MGALPSLVAHVLELLEPLGPARARAMMGGWMFHLRGLPVALIADERLYLKVDALTRDAFAEAGGEPFTYRQGRKRVEMSYWTPPDAALDDAEAMAPWAEKALAAAWRSSSGSGTRSRRTPGRAFAARGGDARVRRPKGRGTRRTRTRMGTGTKSRTRSLSRTRRRSPQCGHCDRPAVGVTW